MHYPYSTYDMNLIPSLVVQSQGPSFKDIPLLHSIHHHHTLVKHIPSIILVDIMTLIVNSLIPQ